MASIQVSSSYPHVDADAVFSLVTSPVVRELVDEKRARELFAPLLEKPRPDIKRLVISTKSFGRDSAPVLVSALHNLPNLTQADFSDCIASRETSEALDTLGIICKGIESSGIQLEVFNLSDNAVGLRGIPVIEPAFKNQKKLTHLYFNNDGISADAASGLVKHIFSNITSSSSSSSTDSTSSSSSEYATTNLRVFEIGHNMLEDTGVIALTPILQHSPYLTGVRVATTRARNEKKTLGGEKLAQSMLGLKHIQVLSLNDQNLGAKAGEYIAEIIKTNRHHLTHVNLADIGVGPESMKKILKALIHVRPNLQVLDLSANELNVSLSRYLAKVLKRQPGLVHVKLEDNELKSTGAVRVVEALLAAAAHTHKHSDVAALKDVVSHSKLHYLNLSNNQLRGQLVTFLSSQLTYGKFPLLNELHLNANLFKADQIQEIKETVKKISKENILQTLSDNDEDDDDEDEEHEESEESEEEIVSDAEAEKKTNDADVDALAAQLSSQAKVN